MNHTITEYVLDPDQPAPDLALESTGITFEYVPRDGIIDYLTIEVLRGRARELEDQAIQLIGRFPKTRYWWGIYKVFRERGASPAVAVFCLPKFRDCLLKLDEDELHDYIVKLENIVEPCYDCDGLGWVTPPFIEYEYEWHPTGHRVQVDTLGDTETPWFGMTDFHIEEDETRVWLCGACDGYGHAA